MGAFKGPVVADAPVDATVEDAAAVGRGVAGDGIAVLAPAVAGSVTPVAGAGPTWALLHPPLIEPTATHTTTIVRFGQHAHLMLRTYSTPTEDGQILSRRDPGPPVAAGYRSQASTVLVLSGGDGPEGELVLTAKSEKELLSSLNWRIARFCIGAVLTLAGIAWLVRACR
jgi:hypothetical protein